MKKLQYLIIIFVLILILGMQTQANATQDMIDFDLGFGVIFSPDYSDLLDRTYPEYEKVGGGGWLDLQLGLKYNFNEMLSIVPSLDLLLSFGMGDVSYTSTIVLPSIRVQYTFKEIPSFYLSGEVNYNSPDTSSDRLDFKSGGAGFGGSIGYAFDGGMNLEIGYLDIPVKINDVQEENLGGVLIKFRKLF